MQKQGTEPYICRLAALCATKLEINGAHIDLGVRETWSMQVVSVHHVLVVRALSSFSVRCAWDDVTKIEVDAGFAPLFRRHSVMPVLLSDDSKAMATT